MQKVNSCTKDEQLLTSHNIDFVLNALGFNLSSKGYIYYRDLILFSWYSDKFKLCAKA